MPVWQAMKAAVMAPWCIQPQNSVSWRPVIRPGLVDYGFAKNNPKRDVLFESRKLFDHANDMFLIVSIGTGYGINRDHHYPEETIMVESRSAEAKVSSINFEAKISIWQKWMDKVFPVHCPEHE